MNIKSNNQHDFTTFISQLQETNQTLDFFCDFNKIERNISNIRISLCILNSLIGAKDIRATVEAIWERDRTAFDVMNILIAVRDEGNKKILDKYNNCTTLNSMFTSVEGVMEFLNSTGLLELFKEQKIKDLADYVFGIETGLDTNARKNRSGHLMENLISKMLSEHGIDFQQEVYSSKWQEITNVLGTLRRTSIS